MENLISVIVPIYNIAEYLPECIESIINQTYKNIEIILVDDGSTDESGKICDEYAKKDRRIVVIHQENQGVNLARTNGLNIAKGDYIGYVDGDDWIEPEMYEYLLGLILEYGADLVDSGVIRKINNTIIYSPERNTSNIFILSDDVKSHLLYNFMITNDSNLYVTPYLASKLVKRNIIQKAQNSFQTNIALGEDQICLFYILQYSSKVVLTNIYHYHYRLRYGSASNNNNLSNSIMELVKVLKEYYRFFNKFGYGEEFKKISNFHIISWFLNLVNKFEQNEYKKYSFYRYPQDKILENKNIALYGAGDIGKGYYTRYTNQNKNIVCWSDKQYAKMFNCPMKIENPDSIKNYEFDYLLIAVFDENLADKIKKDLISKDIPEDKILWNKPQLDLKWLLD